MVQKKPTLIETYSNDITLFLALSKSLASKKSVNSRARTSSDWTTARVSSKQNHHEPSWQSLVGVVVAEADCYKSSNNGSSSDPSMQPGVPRNLGAGIPFLVLPTPASRSALS